MSDGRRALARSGVRLALPLIALACSSRPIGAPSGEEDARPPGSARDAGTSVLPDGGAMRGEDGGPMRGEDSGTMRGEDAGEPRTSCPSIVGTCNAADGTGCAGDEACYPYHVEGARGTLALCAVAGERGDGVSCDDYNDCAPGFACVPYSPMSPTRRCRRNCCGEPCPAGRECRPAAPERDGEALAISVCQLPASCDPVTQLGCEEGLGCYLDGASLSSATSTCLGSTRFFPTGAECDERDGNSCAPGNVCLRLGSAPYRCYAICDFTAPACSEGYDCESLENPAFPALGLCTPA